MQLNNTNNAGVATQLTILSMQKKDIQAAIFKAFVLKTPG